MDLHFKSMPGTLNVDEAKGIVECFVAAIGNKDSVGDIIIPGAFDASLRRRKPRVVWGHDWNQPIGKVLDITEVPPGDPRLPAKMKTAGVGGMWARVQFNLGSERGKEAFSSVAFFGDEQEWSIGYKTIDAVFDPQRQANVLKELELYEVSPVLHGANQLTGTISIKSDTNTVTSLHSSKWDVFDPQYAKNLKDRHPEIWGLGGNIKGNDQFAALYPLWQQGGKATTKAQMDALALREAWVARHAQDFRPAGVVAQIKWLAVGTRGEAYMKALIEEEIARRAKGGTKMDTNPATGFAAALARALSAHMGGRPVLIRRYDANDVRFYADREDQPGQSSPMRCGYSSDGGRFLFALPEPDDEFDSEDAREDGDEEGENRPMQPMTWAPETEQMKEVGIPQEAVSGEVLRGFGPRRGNLERLLRYWRPIMTNPAGGGFRRCVATLADHPELQPVQRLCAWLHHELTGLWPNEGCHHPGMKNCRSKLRRGARAVGSKALMIVAPADGSDLYGEVTDDDVSHANMVFRQFCDAEPEFVKYLLDEANWEHIGDAADGSEMAHPMLDEDGSVMAPGMGKAGCGCGCGAKSDTAVQEKVGRTLSSRNTSKLQQALTLLQEVLGMGAADVQVKHVALTGSEASRLEFFLSPVIDEHLISVERDAEGLRLKTLSDAARIALDAALTDFHDIYDSHTKAAIVPSMYTCAVSGEKRNAPCLSCKGHCGTFSMQRKADTSIS